MPADLHDISRDAIMLTGRLARRGYDWWWHSFTGYSRSTGEERSFFVEFFLVNPGLAESMPVLGQSEANKAHGNRPSYLMVKAGTWGRGAKQLHRFFAWHDLMLSFEEPFHVSADDCFVSETRLVGSVLVSEREAAERPELMSDAGSMRFDLSMNKQLAFNVGWGASKPMRALNLFEMYWHAEGMKTLFQGTVELDGELYDVSPESCFGYADKNWGRGFTSPWLWLASSDLTSMLTGEPLGASAFDIGGGAPKVGPIALPGRLLGEFVHEGRVFEFNFSKPWTRAKTKFSCSEERGLLLFHVLMETRSARLILDARCPVNEMLEVAYEDPRGERRHTHLLNGGTGEAHIQLYAWQGDELILIDNMRAGHLGCEYGEFDVPSARQGR